MQSQPPTDQLQCWRKNNRHYLVVAGRASAMITIIVFGIAILSACGATPSAPAPAPILLPTLTPASGSESGGGAVILPTVTVAPPVAQAKKNIAIKLEPLFTELDRPVFITHANDGSDRLFIVERGGMVRVVKDGVLTATPYLDIRDRVNDGASERGLLGLVFAPDFDLSDHLFVNYTDADGDTVIARFTAANPEAASVDPASEVEILAIPQPASNHNGGMLAFGPDGYLYIGMGDGGAANDKFSNGQNPDTLLGKMLRIDVSGVTDKPYAIPADNPWINVDWQEADVRDEIWAAGLRNPWRFSFDRATGDLWIGDVGQRKYEEIDMLSADAAEPPNFGWPIMEGKQCFPDSAECDTHGLVQPLLDYTHRGNCSVTGGYVYRGANYPALNGVYFYGDYCSGKIWALAANGADGWQNQLLLDTDMSISTFGEDEAGELYVADLKAGDIYQIILNE